MKSPAAATGIWNLLCRYRVWLLGGLALLAVANVAAVALTYLVYPGYLDHGEPSVALISWRLLDGIPAFRGFDEPGRVGNVYGPMTYAIHAVAFGLFGPTMMAGKVASLVAAVLIPVFVWVGQRRKGPEAAALGAVIAAGLVLLHVPASIWNRPDAFMAMLVAIAVAAANAARAERPEWAKSLVIGVAGGIAVGMKLHAGVYFVPIAVYHCINPQRGMKVLLAIAAAGLATVLLPFAFEVFPVAAFLEWIGRHIGKENPTESVIKVARYGVIYLAPVGFYLAARRWSAAPAPVNEWAYLWAYVGCLFLVGYPATKAGAGTHYFLPFAAIFADQVLRHAARLKEGHARRALFTGGVVALAILALSVPVQKRFYRALHWQHVRAVVADIHAIMDRYPGRTIEMGAGDNVKTYRRTFYKTVLVLAGHPYTVDVGLTMETTHMGIRLTNDTLAMIRGCSTDMWLIPKGERPFAMIGYYGSPAIDQGFVDAFLRSYAKVKSFEFFDVWACAR